MPHASSSQCADSQDEVYWLWLGEGRTNILKLFGEFHLDWHRQGSREEGRESLKGKQAGENSCWK